jgi:hypothetical protein
MGYREASGRDSEYPDREDTPSPTLKPRTFKIGMWNICSMIGHDRTNKQYHKYPIAEDLMFIEKIDILVLTETHTNDLLPTLKTSVLTQTGLTAACAGTAILAPNNSS